MHDPFGLSQRDIAHRRDLERVDAVERRLTSARLDHHPLLPARVDHRGHARSLATVTDHLERGQRISPPQLGRSQRDGSRTCRQDEIEPDRQCVVQLAQEPVVVQLEELIEQRRTVDRQVAQRLDTASNHSDQI